MWLWLLLIPSTVFAQLTLPTAEVSTAPGPLLQHSSSPVWRGLEEDLQSSSQIQDTLNKAPGVMFTQSGGIGGVGSFYMRGSESRHVVVLTDGMRLNDPSSTGRNFDSSFLYAPFFQDLIFLRGPAPALYGGDATGGVIELIPRRGANIPKTSMSIAAGTFDTLQGHVLQDWKKGSHQGSFGLAHLRTQGFSRLNRKRHGASENDGAETTQFMQASRHIWNESVTTDLMIYGLTGMAEQDGMSTDETGDRTDNRQATLTQTTQGSGWWIKTGFFTQRREIQAAGFIDQTYRGETRVAQLGKTWGTKSNELITGLEAQQEWQQSPGLQKQNDLGSLFALARHNEEKWTFELGGRGEHHQRYGGFAAGESTFTYRPSDEWALHAKSSRGYKTPSLYQLYAPDTSRPLGNSNLTPEINVSMETGVEWKSAGLVSLVFFQQDFQNLIAYSVAQGYQNRGTLRVQGAEVYIISPEHSWGQASITWTQLDFSHYSQTPLRRPPYLANIGWTKNFQRWTAEMNLRAVGGRKDSSTLGGNAKLVAYELLSAAVKWAPSAEQQWSLRLGNLTDRNYEDVYGYGVAPLNFSLQWMGAY